MRKLLILLLCCWVQVLHAQGYNNEWIDFNKTYYKLKVGSNGLHRVPKAELAAAGLAGVPVEQLQLWRNGVEVPLYTPVPSGVLPDGQAIEFWGERNDGKADKPLYRKPEYQLADVHSLQTDTSVYFLTVNPAGGNRRLNNTPNNVAGNTLAPEPYFNYTLVQAFRNQLNGGYAVDVDQFLYSSAYDLGEGYSSAFIGPNGTSSLNLGNLFVAPGGPAATFRITVAGSRIAQRRYLVRVNSDSILGGNVDFFDAASDSARVPLSVISSASNNVQVTNISSTANDRLAIFKYELSYPRQFHFNNAANFEFELTASATPRYIEISNFNNGTQPPVLLDLTNGLRLTGDIAVAGRVRFVLPAMPRPGKMVLYSQATANLTTLSGLTQRRFTNYALPANQASYVIISNELLFAPVGGANPVAAYAQYRASAVGGGYSTRVYEVDELTDQFGFGVKKTPLALRNFIRFALNQFASRPQHVLLLGKGTIYTEQRSRESDPLINRLNLVPTFGNPASDVLLAAAPGTAVPLVSIGRLSVVTGQEVLDYLDKIRQYEAAQAQVTNDPAAMTWKKNVTHIIGSGDAGIQNSLEQYMSSAKAIIADTLWGADVHTFTKKSGANVEQISDKALEQLFAEGISFINYFGHSSTSGLDYNLDNPDAYNNTGKYPVFTALGCNAGNFFNYSATRFAVKDAISEKYVLAPQKGTIGFIASSHFGIVSTLRSWNTQFYENLATTDYGKPIGEVLSHTAARVIGNIVNGEENFLLRSNIEQTVLHGDPALRLNVQPKPDYVVTEPMIKVDPGFVSVAEPNFRVQVQVRNVGMAISRPLVIAVKRRFPDGNERVIIRDTVTAPLLSENYSYQLPVDALADKGMNRITVQVDAAGELDELLETNNEATKEVFIYEDEARPVYPFNFAIVNQPNVQLKFSTADAFSQRRNYQVEMDTTELFNSPARWSTTVSSVGGVVEVQPSVSLRSGTVYYWRVAVVAASGAQQWNRSSFVYLPQEAEGFNQSHTYQHLKMTGKGLNYDTISRRWQFGKQSNNLFIRHGIWTGGAFDENSVSIRVNSVRVMHNACSFNSLVFVVFDSTTFAPMANPAGGLYGSGANTCFRGRQNNFEYTHIDTAGRRKAMHFMKNVIPDGAYVVVRNFSTPGAPNIFAAQWQADTALYGRNQSLYHYLKEAGYADLDSFNRNRAWILIYQKGVPSFKPRLVMGTGVIDNIVMSADLASTDKEGSALSQLVGPAVSWKQLKWEGRSIEPDSRDELYIDLVGVRPDGGHDTLYRNISFSQPAVDISSVNATRYPQMQVQVRSRDTSGFTPFQLGYWRLTYVPVPEGAVAPNIFFQLKDSLEVGEDLQFKLAFKNVSTTPFDSLSVRMVITDRNNVSHLLPLQKLRPLPGNDTVHVRTGIDTRRFAGANKLFVEVNPGGEQPEKYSFNNFIFSAFHVQEDLTAPIVDVTFDNIRIMNRDIVSAKPDILIRLTDESKQLLLNDTALVRVQVRNLNNNTERTYRFDNDTLRFVPASQANRNEASVNFKPFFAEDGEYELVVTGKDVRGNQAGGAEYKVQFQVINKPMISNMLNYPNPFTTSTAFVFTLTGTEVPQNLKIQVLTVTGRVVREITRDELGPLRIGRNITEFKWDGKDQFGQPLGNGVYLYRVVAQLNGKSLDKYRTTADQTDRFFNNGYGKMYLMR